MTTVERPRRSTNPALSTLIDQAVAAFSNVIDELRDMQAGIAAAAAVPPPEPEKPKNLSYRSDVAAELMNVKPRTVLWLIAHNKLHAVKAGRYWLVPDEEIRRFLKGGKGGAA